MVVLGKAWPDLSLVVTAYGQPDELDRTLHGIAVAHRREPGLAVEVVVVDNGSPVPLRPHPPASLAPAVRLIRRRPGPSPFTPGSARNAGWQLVRGDLVVFLDADCCPGPDFLSAHHRTLTAMPDAVTLGHRVFVDGCALSEEILETGTAAGVERIASASNYGMDTDRRLPELRSLAHHPMPFNCCHGCNIGVSRALVAAVGGFDTAFDGFWGYEDIEFGHRLWRSGARMVYLPDAVVYHQEGSVSSERRKIDRRRNYRLACERIPGFFEFRTTQNRPYYEVIELDPGRSSLHDDAREGDGAA